MRAHFDLRYRRMRHLRGKARGLGVNGGVVWERATMIDPIRHHLFPRS
jgi:hypothetical protein